MITVSSHASTGANIPSTNVAYCLSVKKQIKKGKIQFGFFCREQNTKTLTGRLTDRTGINYGSLLSTCRICWELITP